MDGEALFLRVIPHHTTMTFSRVYLLFFFFSSGTDTSCPSSTVLATVLPITVVLIVLVIVAVFTVVCLRQRRKTLKPEADEKDESSIWADNVSGGKFITVTTYKKFVPLRKVCMYYLNSGYSCTAECEWYVGNS